MLPPRAKYYLISALEANPSVLSHLLKDLGPDDARWDKRPDPERFTLREMVAHLADWEPINIQRLTRIREEDNPFIPDIDEGEMAIKNNYGTLDPIASVTQYVDGRNAVVAFLRELPEEAWQRIATREFLGEMDIAAQATLIAGHDGYHLKQTLDWLAAP